MEWERFYLTFALMLYSFISLLVFGDVYDASKLIVDEEFHLPLGEEYCNFRFSLWDPKITTLPGLYLFSALILGPFGLCTTYWLRTIPLFCSHINLILFYKMFSSNIYNETERVLSALMMNFLPPLYFMAHVYYTDVVSLTSVLLFVLASENNHHFTAALLGCITVMFRQTNVMFVVIYLANYILTRLHEIWIKRQGNISKKYYKFPIEHFGPFIQSYLRAPFHELRFTNYIFWYVVICYCNVFVFFIAFYYVNASITVGDKDEHKLSLHLPQIFYFSTFSFIFGWPHFVGEILRFYKFAKRHQGIVLLAIAIAAFIVHFNTIVHPYLLADNRHFIFYIWSRFYGRYWWFRYAMVPFYIFSIFVILDLLFDRNDIRALITYIMGISFLLVTHSLFEVRYFLLPYILFRFKMRQSGSTAFIIHIELFSYTVLNYIAFNAFFYRIIFWEDMEYPQRVIW